MMHYRNDYGFPACEERLTSENLNWPMVSRRHAIECTNCYAASSPTLALIRRNPTVTFSMNAEADIIEAYHLLLLGRVRVNNHGQWEAVEGLG